MSRIDSVCPSRNTARSGLSLVEMLLYITISLIISTLAVQLASRLMRLEARSLEKAHVELARQRLEDHWRDAVARSVRQEIHPGDPFGDSLSLPLGDGTMIAYVPTEDGVTSETRDADGKVLQRERFPVGGGTVTYERDGQILQLIQNFAPAVDHAGMPLRADNNQMRLAARVRPPQTDSSEAQP